MCPMIIPFGHARPRLMAEAGDLVYTLIETCYFYFIIHIKYIGFMVRDLSFRVTVAAAGCDKSGIYGRLGHRLKTKMKVHHISHDLGKP